MVLAGFWLEATFIVVILVLPPLACSYNRTLNWRSAVISRPFALLFSSICTLLIFWGCVLFIFFFKEYYKIFGSFFAYHFYIDALTRLAFRLSLLATKEAVRILPVVWDRKSTRWMHSGPKHLRASQTYLLFLCPLQRLSFWKEGLKQLIRSSI